MTSPALQGIRWRPILARDPDFPHSPSSFVRSGFLPSMPQCLDALLPSSPNSPFERGAGAELRFELADGRIVGLEHLGFLFELDGAQ